MRDLLSKVKESKLSIDEYCKRKIIRKDPVSSEFKHTYSVFLALCEIIGKVEHKNNSIVNVSRENRYLKFFTRQIENESLKEGVKVLSWNYDNLLGSSHQQFYENAGDYNSSKFKLKITTKNRSFGALIPQVFKLNGMLGYLDDEHDEHYLLQNIQSY